MHVRLSHPDAPFSLTAYLDKGWLSGLSDDAPQAPLADYQAKGWTGWYWDRNMETWAKLGTAAEYAAAVEYAAQMQAAADAFKAEYGVPA
jgi:hypothetical protein